MDLESGISGYPDDVSGGEQNVGWCGDEEARQEAKELLGDGGGGEHERCCSLEEPAAVARSHNEASTG